MIKDQKDAARRHDVPNLDGDPFVDAQDWDIAAFDIAVTDTVNNAASATVKFRNSDTPTVVVLDLVKTGNDGASATSPGSTTARRRPCAGSTGTDAPQARRIGAGEGNRTLVISLEGYQTASDQSRLKLFPCSKRDFWGQKLTLIANPSFGSEKFYQGARIFDRTASAFGGVSSTGRRNTTRRSDFSIESQDLRCRSRSSNAREASAIHWPLFQRSRARPSASAWTMSVHAPPYAYRFNVPD